MHRPEVKMDSNDNCKEAVYSTGSKHEFSKSQASNIIIRVKASIDHIQGKVNT
jgi:hypothetical protein